MKEQWEIIGFDTARHHIFCDTHKESYKVYTDRNQELTDLEENKNYSSKYQNFVKKQYYNYKDRKQ